MGAISELQQTVDTFVTEYRRDRTVQNAYNELTEAKSELEQSFGRYKEVRELAADIIFIVDSGYIRRSVIVDATERLAIRTPRYWLAPAVVAVAAWLKDDEGLYLDSISSALNLDPGKTALFMILLLRAKLACWHRVPRGAGADGHIVGVRSTRALRARWLQSAGRCGQRAPWQTRRPRRCCCAHFASRIWRLRGRGPFGKIAGRYSQPWVAELARTWFGGDRRTWTYGGGQERPR